MKEVLVKVIGNKGILFLAVVFLLGHDLMAASGLLYAAGRPSPGKIRITATVFPLAEFAQAVAGDHADIRLLLPSGAGIHTWQPQPSDLSNLQHSDLFLMVGADLEPWANDLLRSVSGRTLRVIEFATFLPLVASSGADRGRDEDRHGIDPHVWLDFEYDQIIVNRIADILGEIEPASSVLFQDNASSYVDKLKLLDAEYRSALESCRGKTVVIGGHAAFGYLCRRYGLRQASLYGLSPDSAPTPGQMIEIIDRARRENIRTVFFESYVNPRMAKALAKEIRAKILELSPGHNVTKKERAAGITFIELMKRNLNSLREGLGCDKR